MYPWSKGSPASECILGGHRLGRNSLSDSEPISVDTPLFVWERDGGRCRNCSSTQDLPFDHVIPRSWGGSSTIENVQVLCRACNLRKGASLVDGGSR